MGARAARPDFDRWAGPGQGLRPLLPPDPAPRLHPHPHRRTGGWSRPTRTAAEPDGVAYIRCGNRRAAVCPSCSHEYQGDMWHLLYAGVAGGIKDVPDDRRGASAGLRHPDRARLRSGAHHPRTRPAPATPAAVEPPFCRHGRPEHCPRVHADDDPDLGTPLCPDCYDYAGQVAFNWYAPELWRRFTISLRRRLADQLGIPRSQLDEQLVRVVRQGRRVPTPRRRPLPRPHPPRRTRRQLPAPAVPVTAEQLVDAIRAAAAEVEAGHRPVRLRRADLGAAVRRTSSTSARCTAPPSGSVDRADAPGDGRRLHRQVRHQSRRRLRPRPAPHPPAHRP